MALVKAPDGSVHERVWMSAGAICDVDAAGNLRPVVDGRLGDPTGETVDLEAFARHGYQVLKVGPSQ